MSEVNDFIETCKMVDDMEKQLKNDDRIKIVLEIEKAEKEFANDIKQKFDLLGVDIKGIFGGCLRLDDGQHVAVDFKGILDEIKLDVFNKMN